MKISISTRYYRCLKEIGVVQAELKKILNGEDTRVFIEALGSLKDFTKRNKIYFPDEINNLLENYEKDIRWLWSGEESLRGSARGEPALLEKINKGFNQLEREIKQLEREARLRNQ